MTRQRAIKSRSWYELQAAHLKQCTYCGEPATTKDHVPPTSIAGLHQQTVPACMLCNSVLSGNWLMTIDDRKKFLDDWYARHPDRSPWRRA